MSGVKANGKGKAKAKGKAKIAEEIEGIVLDHRHGYKEVGSREIFYGFAGSDNTSFNDYSVQYLKQAVSDDRDDAFDSYLGNNINIDLESDNADLLPDDLAYTNVIMPPLDVDPKVDDEALNEFASDISRWANDKQKTDTTPKSGSCVFLASEHFSLDGSRDSSCNRNSVSSSGSRSSRRIKAKNTHNTQNEGPVK